jgi:hypothetical protein
MFLYYHDTSLNMAYMVSMSRTHLDNFVFLDTDKLQIVCDRNTLTWTVK